MHIFKKRSSRDPDAGRRCDECGSRKLIKYKGELFCSVCEWDESDIYPRLESLSEFDFYSEVDRDFSGRKTIRDAYEEETVENDE